MLPFICLFKFLGSRTLINSKIIIKLSEHKSLKDRHILILTNRSEETKSIKSNFSRENKNVLGTTSNNYNLLVHYNNNKKHYFLRT